jgi:hypothetical protein
VFLVTPVLDGLYYRLGWYDPSGKPANSKIIYTVAAFAAVALCARIGLRMVEKLMPVTWQYVGLVCLVLLFCGSLEAYKKAINYFAAKLPGASSSSSTVTTRTSSSQTAAPPEVPNGQ